MKGVQNNILENGFGYRENDRATAETIGRDIGRIWVVYLKMGVFQSERYNPVPTLAFAQPIQSKGR